MSYQPFPVYNLSSGKITARDPWLLPKDAFETLINCHLRRGVLEKRKGYTEFGRIVHTDIVSLLHPGRRWKPMDADQCVCTNYCMELIT
jgi:hypothetical protein